MNSLPTSLLNVFFRWSTSRKRYAEVSSDHAGTCLAISAGARLHISRLPRCSATSSVPCLNSELSQYGSNSNRSLIAPPNALYASARRSCSANAQLNRSLVLACAKARGSAPSAATDAAAMSSERRKVLGLMVPPRVKLGRSRDSSYYRILFGLYDSDNKPLSNRSADATAAAATLFARSAPAWRRRQSRDPR